MQDKEKTDENDDFSVEIIDVDEEGEEAAHPGESEIRVAERGRGSRF